MLNCFCLIEATVLYTASPTLQGRLKLQHMFFQYTDLLAFEGCVTTNCFTAYSTHLQYESLFSLTFYHITSQ